MASSGNTNYVLSFQGSTMYGFAGMKCTQFALQVMGIDVCSIIPDSYLVHFFYDDWSARTNYTIEDVEKMYAGLKANGLHTKFTHLISGFFEKKEMTMKMAEIVKDIKLCNPGIIYVCDPIIGDEGKVYETYSEDTTSLYKDVLLPLADVTTPNQFEVERLSGVEIKTQDDALKAIQRIHDIGPSIVIMTSSKLENNEVLSAFGSRWQDGKREVYRIDFPRIDMWLLGTGDLYLGCITGQLIKTGDLKESFEKSISMLQVVCQRTYKDAKERAEPGNKITPDLLELRIPQCTSFILNPEVLYPSTKVL